MILVWGNFIHEYQIYIIFILHSPTPTLPCPPKFMTSSKINLVACKYIIYRYACYVYYLRVFKLPQTNMFPYAFSKRPYCCISLSLFFSLLALSSVKTSPFSHFPICNTCVLLSHSRCSLHGPPIFSQLPFLLQIIYPYIKIQSQAPQGRENFQCLFPGCGITCSVQYFPVHLFTCKLHFSFQLNSVPCCDMG